MKTAWIVSEGSPGHVSQSVGLAEGLAALTPIQTVTVKGRSRVRGWMRPLVRRMMGPTGRPLSDFMLRLVADVEIPANSPAPDLIISSGGKSVFAARTLAERYNVPYVYIGERKPYPSEWFHTVVSPVPRESSANSIDVELIPTPVTPELIAQKGDVERGVWCMIIGGASRSHRFAETDWVALAEGMNVLAERENIRWLLTTSRRTGAAAEAILKEHLHPEIIKDAIWWAEQPRRELYAFMARSEVLFVTQDSVTMVTEAVSAGKPVVVVAPEVVSFPDDSFMIDYLDRLEKNGRILKYAASKIGSVAPSNTEFRLFSKTSAVSVPNELLKRLRT